MKSVQGTIWSVPPLWGVQMISMPIELFVSEKSLMAIYPDKPEHRIST